MSITARITLGTDPGIVGLDDGSVGLRFDGGDSFLGSRNDSRSIPEAIVIGMSLGIIVLATIIGNLFVILAIIIEKDLRRPQYLLILSLAVADLMIGCIVAPISTVYELQNRWTMGMLICDAWTSVDVLACTSSILHLVAIAIDRYWSVTDISYVQRRTPTRIMSMLAVVWTLSAGLSLAPFAGWKDVDFQRRVQVEGYCLISQEVSYQLFSTFTAFYLPLLLIMFIYWRVFKAAKRRFQRERDRKAPTMANDPRKSTVGLTAATNGCGSNYEVATPNSPRSPNPNSAISNGKSTQVTVGLDETVVTLTSSPASMGAKRKRKRRRRGEKESQDEKRERKAWRTLAIITGTFVMCWLPFFILAIARPLLKVEVPRPIEGFVGWLGYLNSAINPIIYTIFSPDFRMAFQKMLRRLITWK